MAKRPTRLTVKVQGPRGLVRTHRVVDPATMAKLTQDGIERAADAALASLDGKRKRSEKAAEKPKPALVPKGDS